MSFIKRLCVCLAVSVVCVCLVACPILAAAGSTPTPDFLAAALQSQASAVGASLSAQFFTRAMGPAKAGGSWYETSYVRTSSCHWMEETRGTFYAPNIEARTAHEKILERYDKAKQEARALITTLASGQQTGRIESHIPWNSAARFPIVDPVLFRVGDAPLKLAIKNGVVSEGKEDVDGHACWNVQIKESGKSVSTSGNPVVQTWDVLLDPAIGFCPRRITMHMDDGTVANTHTVVHSFADYQETGDGVWFPGKYTMLLESEKNVGWVTEVHSVVTGEEVSADRLDVVIPSKTRVLKLPEGAYIQAP